MNGADNPYSRFVSWAKVLLPLAAIGLLSTLFLFSTGRGTDDTLPYADLEAIARETRLTDPNFAGVTEDGASYSLSAEMARPLPDRPEVLRIDKIRANLATSDGLSVEITATVGDVNPSARTLELSELARLGTSNGYVMETTGLRADFNEGRIESTGPLEIRAPYGMLTAGKLVLQQGKDAQGSQMVFNDGVRLVYQPQQ